MADDDKIRSALATINNTFNCDLGVTVKGNELKGWNRDIDGACKFYLGAKDCHELAEAFATVANALTAEDVS